MKTKLFLLSFLLPASLFCQIDEWTAAIPLTDSLTDNRNAIVAELDFNSVWDHYVIWEKSFDENTTHIYGRMYYFDEDPFVIAGGDYHNTDPCLLRLNNWYHNEYDTSFFLFYLSDRDGDFDIFYKTYSNSGWSEDIKFTDTPGDEKHLQSNSASGLTWELEGSIRYVALKKNFGGPFYFTDINTVDTIDCHNPVIEPMPTIEYGERFLAWEKTVSDSSKVMLSYWNYEEDTWGDPEMLPGPGHCTNLRFEESSWSEVWPTLAWDRLDGTGQLQLTSYDPYYQDHFYLGLEQEPEFIPTIFNIFVGVSDTWFFALLSFMKDEGGQTDIYGGYQQYWWPGAYTNLSVSSAIERNPHLWNGIIYYAKQDVINIWESNRNGHWQLWTSRTQVPLSGSVKEKDEERSGELQVSPNPFTDQVTVSYLSNKKGKGKLCFSDIMGRNAGVSDEVDIREGMNSWKLLTDKKSPGNIPSGIYLIQLEFGDRIISRKVAAR